MKSLSMVIVVLFGALLVSAGTSVARAATVERIELPRIDLAPVPGGLELLSLPPAPPSTRNGPAVAAGADPEPVELRLLWLRGRQFQLERRLHAEWLVDSPDMKQVHARVDEIGRLRTEIAHLEADRVAALQLPLAERTERARACGIGIDVETGASAGPPDADPFCVLMIP
jgi:hypothetical protein